MIDPGTVVWLPDGGGWSGDYVCGLWNMWDCGEQHDMGGVWVYCCPY
jgi:hypothetical protein